MDGWDKPLTDWTDEIELYTNKEVRRLANKSLQKVIQRTPSVSGALRAAWYMKEMMNDGLLSTVIANDTEYVVFVEYGTDKMVGHHMLERTINELIEGIIK